MNRREFLSATAGIAALRTSAEAAAPVPIIDTHVHLYDPTRPQGVPWPDKTDATLYKPTLPDRFRSVTKGLGIVGMVEVECSPWVEDNQWVLDIAAKDRIIVGTVGNLDPTKPDFRKHLERFHRNPLFRGIRYDFRDKCRSRRLSRGSRPWRRRGSSSIRRSLTRFGWQTWCG